MINFNTSNQKLIEALKDYIPSSWLIANGDGSLNIYHNSFPETSTDWEAESSSDVYSPAPFVGIQRDFCAKKLSNSSSCYVFFNNEIDDGLHNFMRWLLSPSLIELDKVILHSSALVTSDDRPYLFLGPSGAGKTTIASLARDHLVLSDDMNLLDFSLRPKIYPGGVGGLYKPEVSIAKGFNIRTGYWIIQSNVHEVRELSRKKQAQYLLASLANISWQSVSSVKSQMILDSVEKILDLLTIKELHFKKDSHFWDII
jgi:hypothetical protein